jgi:hypothetical protein
MPIHLKTDALWLHDMQGLGCLALLPFSVLLLGGVRDEVWKKILRCERRRDTRTLCMF